MTQAARSHAPLLAFVLSLSAIYVVALSIVSRLAQFEQADLLAAGLTLDLTLLVPTLYYFLLVRLRGWPAITIVPLFLASFALAHWIIPDTQHHVLDAMEYLVALLEICVVGLIIYKVVRLRRSYVDHSASSDDFYGNLRDSAASVLGPTAGNAIASELAVFYYAGFTWRQKPRSGERCFSYHQKAAYGTVAAALMIAVAVETAAVHALVQLWSPLVAWILTAIGIYTLIWLLGDTQAARLRPIRLTDDTLHVRLGLRWSVDVPLESIVRVEAIHEKLPRGTCNYLNAVLIGAPNRRIELSQAVVAHGMYGFSRRVETLDLQIDDPDRFDAALRPGSDCESSQMR